MAETDTSPAALRALAKEILETPPFFVAMTARRQGKAFTQRVAMVLAALAAEKEAGAPALALDMERAKEWLDHSAPAPDAEPLRFTYRNYKGDVAERSVLPRSVRFGSTEWHPKPQWLLLAYDVDKQADREFAMRDMSPPAPDPDGWIPWWGGNQPVADTTCVDVRFRNGVEDPCYPACGYQWDHEGGIDDIIAYRLSKKG